MATDPQGTRVSEYQWVLGTPSCASRGVAWGGGRAPCVQHCRWRVSDASVSWEAGVTGPQGVRESATRT